MNARHSRCRRRFTIAHEIGYFILHRDLIGDGIHDLGSGLEMRSKLQSSLEAQANQYAKSILMPLCQVRTAINSPGPIDDASISHLAARFDVPVSAMLAKLKQALPGRIPLSLAAIP